MSARIIQGDVMDVLPTLKRGSVDCVVTSPPYWMLRSYLPQGHALKSFELGSEPTPTAYVANMVKVFSLVRDVMAEHGTCFLNVGDTYAASGRGGGGGSFQDDDVGTCIEKENGRRAPQLGFQQGDLCLIPQRLAIALQDAGWIVRSVIVWHKPAPMPSSVSGWSYRRCRVRRGGDNGRRAVKVDATGGNHRAVASFKDDRTAAGKALSAEGRTEWSDCPGCKHCTPHGGYRLRRGSWRPTSSWEPVLMLAKSAGYFADGEPVRQPSAAATVSRNEYTRVLDDPDEQFAVKHDHETTAAGANLRDVWTIAAEPLKEKHYAAFPTELVHRCLAAGTSAKGYCPACGAPWVRCIEEKRGDTEANGRPKQTSGMTSHTSTLSLSGNGSKEWAERGTNVRTIGWRPSCPCPPHEPRPGLVLDPFAGSARTGIEALRMGLDFVGVDLNPEYVAMSRKLLRAESPLFAEVTP